MDAELKALLTKLLGKLDTIDARLREVERKAHDQVTPMQIHPALPQWPWVRPAAVPPKWDHLYATNNDPQIVSIC